MILSLQEVSNSINYGKLVFNARKFTGPKKVPLCATLLVFVNFVLKVWFASSIKVTTAINAIRTINEIKINHKYNKLI